MRTFRGVHASVKRSIPAIVILLAPIPRELLAYLQVSCIM